MIIEGRVHEKIEKMIASVWVDLENESDEVKEYFLWRISKHLVYSEYPNLNEQNKRWVPLMKEFHEKVLVGSLPQVL